MASGSSSRFIILLIVVALGGFLSGLVQHVIAHEQCSVSQDPDKPNEINHYGDEHANNCFGGNGRDDMFGFGANDDLGGGTGRDRIRGAGGNDILTDGQGQGDEDKFCDGSGNDTIHMDDNDPNDHFHRVSDGQADLLFVDLGDTDHMGQAGHADCPMAD